MEHKKKTPAISRGNDHFLLEVIGQEGYRLCGCQVVIYGTFNRLIGDKAFTVPAWDRECRCR